MKQFFTATLLVFLSLGATSQTVCNSIATTYDLTVFGTTVISPTTSSPYTMGYVCGGAVLIDSSYCCTRICHVDTGGTLIAGPLSYGSVYLHSGATFDGQGTAQNWFVYAAPGATVVNYSGNVVQCTSVTFPSAMCFMSVPETAQAGVSVLQTPVSLQFRFTKPLSGASVELFDAAGSLVLTSACTASESTELNVSDLPVGIYMYRVTAEDETVSTGKIAITH